MIEETVVQVFLNGRPVVRCGDFSIQEGWVELPELAPFTALDANPSSSLDISPLQEREVVYKRYYGQVTVKAFPRAGQ